MGCRTVIKKFITNCTPTCPDVEAWVFSNANVDGQGVFYQQTGTAVEFYGLMNTDGYITVTLDAANKAISIDLDAALIAGSIPDATTTVKGKVELSTDAEAQAKTDTARALTPSNLAAVTASTTATGLVELATSPETITGTDTTRATTPAGVKAALDAVTALQVVVNDAARTAATPAHIGQQLYQTDTESTYFGTALSAGGWEGPFIKLNSSNSPTAPTYISANTAAIQFDPSGVGVISYTGAHVFDGSAIFKGISFSTFESNMQIDEVSIPADSLLGTDSSAGIPKSYLITDFISVHNFSSAYAPINDVALRAFDADTVTLPQLADVVATLIRDLAIVKLPQIT